MSMFASFGCLYHESVWRRIRCVLFGAWGVVIFSCVACKKGAPVEPSEFVGDSNEKSTAILREYSEFVRSKNHIHVTIRHTVSIGAGDNASTSTPATYSMLFTSPGRIRLLQQSGFGGVSVVSDGHRIQVWRTPFKSKDVILADVALSERGPIDAKTIGQRNSGLLDGLYFFKSIIAEDPYSALLRTMYDIKYIGQENVGGEDQLHLTMRCSDMELDVWFLAGNDRVLRRVVAKSTQLSSEILFSDWSFEPIDERVFAVPSPKLPLPNGEGH